MQLAQRDGVFGAPLVLVATLKETSSNAIVDTFHIVNGVPKRPLGAPAYPPNAKQPDGALRLLLR